MLMLDLVDRQIGDLREGWLDSETGELKHENAVPLSTVFGTDEVKAEVARDFVKAVDRLVALGEVQAKEKWKALLKILDDA